MTDFRPSKLLIAVDVLLSDFEGNLYPPVVQTVTLFVTLASNERREGLTMPFKGEVFYMPPNIFCLNVSTHMLASHLLARSKRRICIPCSIKATLAVSTILSGLFILNPGVTRADPPVLGGAAVSSAASDFDSHAGMYTDVLFGRNVKGPYLLAWKLIRGGSETVTRDGVVLKRDQDYTFDPNTGAISFPTPLSPNQIVRIIYFADTADARPNVSSLSLPLQWTLWSQSKNHLIINSLYKQEMLGTDKNPLNSSLQFVGGTKFTRASDLSSGLFFDLHGGDWMARSGAKFAEHTKLGNAEFGAGYSYAGALFTQGDASGLAAAREIMQANGIFSPLAGLKLTGLVRETNELLDAAKLKPGDRTQGKRTLESVETLSLALPQRGKIDATRGATTVTDSSGGSVTTTIDSVKVQRQIIAGTQAAVGYEAQTVIPTSKAKGEEKDQGTYSQKTLVEVKSTPISRLTLTGSFRNALGGANAGDTQAFHIETTPFASVKQFKLSTGYEDIYQDGGAQRRREALVELPAIALVRTQLSGGVQQIGSVGKEQIVEILNAKSRPFRYLEVNGGAKLRQGTLADNVPDPSIVSTYNLKFSISPSRLLKLTGSVIHNPEGDSGAIKRLLSHSIGLESDLGLLLFKGQYGVENEYMTARLSNMLNLGVDLRLTKWDMLTTGLEGRSLFDKDLTSSMTYRVGFTHRLGSAFDFNVSGSYRQNALNGNPTADRPEIKAEAKVGLHF